MFLGVDKSEYVAAHGVEPTGKGLWRFDIRVHTEAANMGTMLTFNGSFWKAAKAAKREAKKQAAYWAQVSPTFVLYSEARVWS